MSSFDDLKCIRQLGQNHLNVTIGSALDLFGGVMEYDRVIAFAIIRRFKMAKYSKNDIIRIVDEEDIEFIRLQFTDIFGTLKTWQLQQASLRRHSTTGACSTAHQ